MIEIDELFRSLPGQFSAESLTIVTEKIRRLELRFSNASLHNSANAPSPAKPTRSESQRLITYARAAGTVAIRRKEPPFISAGLAALAIEGGQLDYRDSLVALSLLCHSARLLGLDERQLCSNAARLSPSAEFAQTVTNFPNRNPEQKDISAFGLVLREGPSGLTYTQSPPKATTFIDRMRRWWKKQYQNAL
jgi:hypothetical protein